MNEQLVSGEHKVSLNVGNVSAGAVRWMRSGTCACRQPVKRAWRRLPIRKSTAAKKAAHGGLPGPPGKGRAD